MFDLPEKTMDWKAIDFLKSVPDKIGEKMIWALGNPTWSRIGLLIAAVPTIKFNTMIQFKFNEVRFYISAS